MNYFYDENNVRYTLLSTHGKKPLNWLFIPGGPGCDSSYLTTLAQPLKLSGNTWLIDLPGNGSHTVKKEGFDDWLSLFIPTIKHFQNPVIVGHSFGAMLPLLFDELEDLLSGFIILNSAPCLWLEVAVQFAKDHGLPDLSKEMEAFAEDPNEMTFKRFSLASIPYYFSPKNWELGKRLFENISVSLAPILWWQHKAVEMPYDAYWVPKNVKTLVLGGSMDAITPFSLFEQDKRFNRKNIEKKLIKDTGHFCWLEQPEKVKMLIKAFEETI